MSQGTSRAFGPLALWTREVKVPVRPRQRPSRSKTEFDDADGLDRIVIGSGRVRVVQPARSYDALRRDRSLLGHPKQRRARGSRHRRRRRTWVRSLDLVARGGGRAERLGAEPGGGGKAASASSFGRYRAVVAEAPISTSSRSPSCRSLRFDHVPAGSISVGTPRTAVPMTAPSSVSSSRYVGFRRNDERQSGELGLESRKMF